MVNHKEVGLEGSYYLVYGTDKVISNITYFTDQRGLNLAERILVEEFGCVDNDDGERTDFSRNQRALVYERDIDHQGIAHFHLHLNNGVESHIGTHLYLHHWLSEMIPEDFKEDATRKILQRLYEELQPEKVTGLQGISLEDKLPWEK